MAARVDSHWTGGGQDGVGGGCYIPQCSVRMLMSRERRKPLWAALPSLAFAVSFRSQGTTEVLAFL